MTERMFQFVLDTKGKRERQNMIWNMVGSFCYAFASMVLSFLVMRLAGEDDGGIFAVAFGVVGQQMFNLAYYGLRPYQVTDEAMEFTFGDYLSHRKATCVAAVGLGCAYLAACLLAGEYTYRKAAVVFLMVIYKVIDGFADVYESEFQRNGNLHLTGKSNTYRTLLSVSCFLLALAATRRLLFSCAVAVAAQVAGVVSFDSAIIRRLAGIDWSRGKGQTARLFRQSTLLFLSVFLDFYILSAGKYAIDFRMADADSGYYNILFMPTLAINLAAGFVIRPFLTGLTGYWVNGQYPQFRRLLRQIGAAILALSVAAVAGAALLGPWVLRMLEILLGEGYQGRLTSNQAAFTAIVLGGGFYAMLNLMYYALVIMRRQSKIFAAYGVAAVAAFGLAYWMVGQMGLFGAALSYLVLMAGLSFGFGALVLLELRSHR